MEQKAASRRSLRCPTTQAGPQWSSNTSDAVESNLEVEFFHSTVEGSYLLTMSCLSECPQRTKTEKLCPCFLLVIRGSQRFGYLENIARELWDE